MTVLATGEITRLLPDHVGHRSYETICGAVSVHFFRFFRRVASVYLQRSTA